MLGINFHDHLVWDAIGIIVLMGVLVALLPKFDSTDDAGWGDDHGNED